MCWLHDVDLITFFFSISSSGFSCPLPPTRQHWTAFPLSCNESLPWLWSFNKRSEGGVWRSCSSKKLSAFAVTKWLNLIICRVSHKLYIFHLFFNNQSNLSSAWICRSCLIPSYEMSHKGDLWWPTDWVNGPTMTSNCYWKRSNTNSFLCWPYLFFFWFLSSCHEPVTQNMIQTFIFFTFERLINTLLSNVTSKPSQAACLT